MHTLVLLLIGSALVAMVLSIGLGRTRDANADVMIGRLELAAESGVQNVLFQLMARGGRPADDALLPAGLLKIDGFDVQTVAQFSDGLVGLRGKEKRHLHDVLVAVLGMRAWRAFDGLASATVPSSYAELASLDGVGVGGLVCLLPYVTLYSDSGTPVAAHAPLKLRNLLALKADTRASAMQNDSVSLAGSIIRIQAQASAQGYRSRHLFVEAMLTGRTDRPVLIFEWFWIPTDRGGSACSDTMVVEVAPR